jgi:hypothetical protein
VPRRSWNLEGKEQQHTPKLDCATHTTDGPISRKGERKSPKLLTVEHATHRDQTRHVDLTQPKVMAGAAPKVAATVMAAEVTTAALVAMIVQFARNGCTAKVICNDKGRVQRGVMCV